MDHFRILKRAFFITKTYRILWVFGILLALTTVRRGGGNGNNGGGGGGGGGSGGGGGYQAVPFDLSWEWPQGPEAIWGVVVVLLFVILLLIIFSSIIRYVSETALIRTVDEYEKTETQVSLGQGFRWGWSRAAFRLWLIDLVLTLPVLLGFLLLLGVALSPLLLWLIEVQILGVLGTILTIGLVFFLVLLLIVVIIILSLFVQFMRRYTVIEDLGVMDSIRRGISLVCLKLGDVIIMGLLLFGISLAFSLLMVPVIIFLALVGFLLAALPALLLALFFSPITAGVVVILPIVLGVIIVPATFLTGLLETFKSSTWTLTFRELLALDESGLVDVVPEDEEPVSQEGEADGI